MIVLLTVLVAVIAYFTWRVSVAMWRLNNMFGVMMDAVFKISSRTDMGADEIRKTLETQKEITEAFGWFGFRIRASCFFRIWEFGLRNLIPKRISTIVAADVRRRKSLAKSFVDLKFEFNQSNRGLYGSDRALIEGKVVDEKSNH